MQTTPPNPNFVGGGKLVSTDTGAVEVPSESLDEDSGSIQDDEPDAEPVGECLHSICNVMLVGKCVDLM